MRNSGNIFRPGMLFLSRPRAAPFPVFSSVFSSVYTAVFSALILCWLAFPPATSLAQGRKNTASAGMTKAEVIIGKEVIRVDVADTPSLQSKGLGGRKQLGPNTGMLFVYTEKGRHAFWMRGMFIPIDIIWLDNRRVVHIEHNVPPPSPGTPESKLATYVSTAPANLVLELAAGRAKALGLKPGSQVTFRFNTP